MAKKKASKDENATEVKGAPGEERQVKLLQPDRVLHHLNTFKGYQAKRETLNGHYRNARKVCKAEGIDPTVIDEAIKLERDDPETYRDKYEQTAQVLRAVGAPFQLQIFDSRYSDPAAQATAEGEAAGRAGRPMDCRYPEGSAAAKAYEDAYGAAQAAIVNGVTDEDVERSIEARRPIALEEGAGATAH